MWTVLTAKSDFAAFFLPLAAWYYVHLLTLVSHHPPPHMCLRAHLALNLARTVSCVRDDYDLISVLRCCMCRSCRNHGVMCMWPDRVNEARLRLWHVWCVHCNCRRCSREALACCRREIENLQPTWRNVAITDYTRHPSPWSDPLEKCKHSSEVISSFPASLEANTWIVV